MVETLDAQTRLFLTRRTFAVFPPSMAPIDGLQVRAVQPGRDDGGTDFNSLRVCHSGQCGPPQPVFGLLMRFIHSARLAEARHGF